MNQNNSLLPLIHFDKIPNLQGISDQYIKPMTCDAFHGDKHRVTKEFHLWASPGLLTCLFVVTAVGTFPVVQSAAGLCTGPFYALHCEYKKKSPKKPD